MEFEELRRQYFLPEADDRSFTDWMGRAMDAARHFIQDQSHKIHGDITLGELEKLFSEAEIPETPQGLDAVFREAVEQVMEHSVRLSNPRYVGHMTGSIPYFGLLVDILTAAMNQNVVKIETALSASFVERQTLAWLHNLIYMRESGFYEERLHRVDVNFGTVTNGGTVGNLTALAVARNRLLPEAVTEGLPAAMRKAGVDRLVILASSRVHYSIKKVASLLGIGSANVIEIPVSPYTNQINVAELRKCLIALKKTRTQVLAIVGIAGSTETGSIDNLQVLADIAENERIWFHVDAAWGGSFLMSRKNRRLLAGMDRADSVVVDGHKLFYMPLAHGAVLFRDPSALNSILHSANYIIRAGSVDLGRTSLEGSRRFDSFKLWFFFKTLGRMGYATLVDRSLELAADFALQIENSNCFEVTSLQETNILTYRYVPSAWKGVLARLKLDLRHASEDDPRRVAVAFVNRFLNDVNIDLQKQQRQNGRSFVSRTTLESIWLNEAIVVLRVVLFNPMTTAEILADIMLEQENLATEIVRQRWPRVVCSIPGSFSPLFATSL